MISATYPGSIAQSFEQNFGRKPALVVRAPGHINLLGEHTDYNEGWVLPAAIDRAIWLAVAPRTDAALHLVAHDLGEKYTGSLHQLEKSGRGWPDYLLGVFHVLQQENLPVAGMDVVFGGDIPIGAGLSSSAALEGGMLFAINELHGFGLERPQLARLAQRAENEFVGMKCGIMDMYASLMGRAGHFLRLDCRTLATEYAPFDAPDWAFVLCDSGVKHALVDSEYNQRRRECEAGVAILRRFFPEIRSLRDVSEAMLDEAGDALPKLIRARCRYVVAENGRVEKMCIALKNNDLQTIGQLMFDTHEGLRTGYEVSCAEMDFLVETARRDPAVQGARMMGGGFGGCTLNLVRRADEAHFKSRMQQAFRQKWARELACFSVQLSDGTGLCP